MFPPNYRLCIKYWYVLRTVSILYIGLLGGNTLRQQQGGNLGATAQWGEPEYLLLIDSVQLVRKNKYL